VDGCEILHQLGWLKPEKNMECSPSFSTAAGFRNHPQELNPVYREITEITCAIRRSVPPVCGAVASASLSVRSAQEMGYGPQMAM